LKTNAEVNHLGNCRVNKKTEIFTNTNGLYFLSGIAIHQPVNQLSPRPGPGGVDFLVK
jgi:hypothetical protein